MGHHPSYSNGEHGNNSDIITNLEPLFWRYNVAAYFVGELGAWCRSCERWMGALFECVLAAQRGRHLCGSVRSDTIGLALLMASWQGLLSACISKLSSSQSATLLNLLTRETRRTLTLYLCFTASPKLELACRPRPQPGAAECAGSWQLGPQLCSGRLRWGCVLQSLGTLIES